ncbi:MAG: hypothetical protein LBL58_02040 [Tannerellaceae bacterium]|jgi:hypothetical protein|nr:hypothetical protein [Tannerellaceae bacterium]
MESTSNTNQVKIFVPSEKKGSFLKRFIKTLSLYVYMPTLLILSISILYNFVLIDIDEIFKGGYKIGIYVNTLCMSYLAGFIFYFVSIHIPFIIRKEKRVKYIHVSVMKIITYTDDFILRNLMIYGFEFKDKYPTDAEWEANIQGGKERKNVDWANEFLNLIDQVQREINKISAENDLFSEIYDLILPIQNTGLMGSYKGISDNLKYGEPGERYIFHDNVIKDFLEKVHPLYDYYEENIVPSFFPNGKPQEVELDIK